MPNHLLVSRLIEQSTLCYVNIKFGTFKLFHHIETTGCLQKKNFWGE